MNTEALENVKGLRMRSKPRNAQFLCDFHSGNKTKKKEEKPRATEVKKQPNHSAHTFSDWKMVVLPLSVI